MSKSEVSGVRPSTPGEVVLSYAGEHRIPVDGDPDLLQQLDPLGVEDEIPMEAYVAVAQVLAFLYDENGRSESSRPPPIS